jgi:hypothetical protein
MKRLKPGDLVYVETDDIEHADQGWQALAAIAATKPRTFRTVGWVVRVTKRTLTLTPMAGTEGRHADDAHCAYLLPRRAITKIKRLVT